MKKRCKFVTIAIYFSVSNFSTTEQERIEGVMSKNEYIEKIEIMLEKCNDIPLIDLIYRLLAKSL